MVAGKFLHLMDFPDLTVASGFTEEDYRLAPAVDLIMAQYPSTAEMTFPNLQS